MNCTEFEVAAQTAVESRSSLTLAAIEHLSTCAGCRQAWELQQQLDEAIDAWRMTQPSTTLADAVLAELASLSTIAGHDSFDPFDFDPFDFDTATEPAKLTFASPKVRSIPVEHTAEISRRSTHSASIAMVVVAACLVIAALFATRFGGDVGRDVAKIQKTQRAEIARTDVPLDVSGTLTEVLSDLKTEYRGIANETEALAREFAIALPARVDVSTLPESDTIELLPDSSGMVRMLQPIGSRVESAFGFLWNAIPSELPSG